MTDTVRIQHMIEEALRRERARIADAIDVFIGSTTQYEDEGAWLELSAAIRGDD